MVHTLLRGVFSFVLALHGNERLQKPLSRALALHGRRGAQIAALGLRVPKRPQDAFPSRHCDA